MRHGGVLAATLAAMVLGASPARAEVVFTVGVGVGLGASEGAPRLSIASVPVGDDKLQHFVAGLAIAWLLSSAGYAPGAALMGTGAAGALKEARDAGLVPGLGRGQVEASDLAWTLAGGAAYLGLRQALAPRPAPWSLHNN